MATECEIKPLPPISDTVCNDYFSCLGHLSRRILVEQEVLQSMSAWEAMNDKDRAEATDNYFAPASVRKKFDKNDETVSEDDERSKVVYFPRYSVKSGEKIVVDFENGFSTWEDEHSGPFSWESKAQREDNPFEIDIRSFRKSKTPRERTQSSSEEKSYAFNPNKSIWDSPFLKADGANPLEASGFGDLFSDMGGLTMSPTNERCESPPLLEDLNFDGEQVTESTNDELEKFCSREALDSEVSSQKDDDHSSLGDYIEMSENSPDPPVIKLRTPFSFKKSKPKVEKVEEPKKPEPVIIPTAPYATTNIANKEAKKQDSLKRGEHYPLYEPEPIPQPRVYRRAAPKKKAPEKPPPVAQEEGEIYEPVMVSGGSAVAQPYEVVDLEQLNIESLPLPPEDDGQDANNEYYQSFDDRSALTSNDFGAMELNADDLPPPDLDFGDVITEQPGFGEAERISSTTKASSPMKTGFDFLDNW